LSDRSSTHPIEVAVIIPQSHGTEPFAVWGLLQDETATLGTSVMTDNEHRETIRRKPLPEAAHEEMMKFERTENEFRRKDREERASELHLPLNEIKIH
jgi:hypothetical protein